MQVFQNTLNLINLRLCINVGTTQKRKHKLFLRAAPGKLIPELVRKFAKAKLRRNPLAQLAIHNGMVDQVKIIAHIIAQFFYRIDPKMNTSDFIGLLCPFIMT